MFHPHGFLHSSQPKYTLRFKFNPKGITLHLMVKRFTFQMVLNYTWQVSTECINLVSVLYSLNGTQKGLIDLCPILNRLPLIAYFVFFQYYST